MVGINNKIMVLGANGMLGHKLIQVLSRDFEVVGTIRKGLDKYLEYPFFKDVKLIDGITADRFNTVSEAIQKENPDFVINCIGIVKQLPEAQDAIQSISINALFPHQLASICQNIDAKLIHYSTDCVFSGSKGSYKENDFPDANDLYGRTKFLGEVNYQNSLTLRTSIIGRELNDGHSLVEWFISQNGRSVKGFKKAIFSGLTTLEHGNILCRIINEFPDLTGVWNLASEPISKFDLLDTINKYYDLDITIESDDSLVIDRSLDGLGFRNKTGIIVPNWEDMISEMYLDERNYNI
ncbi:dTDP-4-dehydrorhamnose reductase family protein [Methanoplanus endosymbiosus]|uniref:SDR family oxidoreductase n=1 Tax=Methanoplanus endosymbiosus TaxID=33865 RepID=A0A9E7PNJ0_9EURY|nr:SDR family oxidoreductase [Methanoplanus endosymbiosus]UUX92229.1 SDR family oxidoreductase [Methanoplanus endosymbiosus]